ncbi:hypothetical protein PAI11_05130 [Patulibacter medicamentivorans]|uniref:Regulatory protein n=1 Tax=Patulibacter medicamentivorans TaxID=1097667 RepID=H0E153_9ACTN|nr:helix-turn-helix domain-containing protein [Patulibacter medicamentivorans]EHN12573.1 hypothetical protein PAI11_05130 [Patulibacter medicamentivorans]
MTPPPATTDSTTAEIRDAAQRLDLDETARALTDRVLADAFPERSSDRAFVAIAERSVRENVVNLRSILSGTTRVEETRPRPGALEFAGAVAEMRLPASSLEGAYRAGQNSFWSAWFQVARDHSQGSGLPLDDYLDWPSTQLFAYINHILTPVIAQYERVAAERRSGREHLRETVLRDLLEDRIAEPDDDVARALGYRLEGSHLFLLLQTGSSRRPEEEATQLRAALAASESLLHRHGLHEWGLWLGASDAFPPAAIARLKRVLAGISATVAVGTVGRGLSGFRQTRRRALEAARVQAALGGAPSVVWDADVRLEALLIDDEERAGDFVVTELGPLAAEDGRAARLRDTLLTWLATGSHVSTAATLGVHEHTVRNRIREIEALLQTPVAGRRAELQVALRLHRVLAGTR